MAKAHGFLSNLGFNSFWSTWASSEEYNNIRGTTRERVDIETTTSHISTSPSGENTSEIHDTVLDDQTTVEPALQETTSVLTDQTEVEQDGDTEATESVLSTSPSTHPTTLSSSNITLITVEDNLTAEKEDRLSTVSVADITDIKLTTEALLTHDDISTSGDVSTSGSFVEQSTAQPSDDYAVSVSTKDQFLADASTVESYGTSGSVDNSSDDLTTHVATNVEQSTAEPETTSNKDSTSKTIDSELSTVDTTVDSSGANVTASDNDISRDPTPGVTNRTQTLFSTKLDDAVFYFVNGTLYRSNSSSSVVENENELDDGSGDEGNFLEIQTDEPLVYQSSININVDTAEDPIVGHTTSVLISNGDLNTKIIEPSSETILQTTTPDVDTSVDASKGETTAAYVTSHLDDMELSTESNLADHSTEGTVATADVTSGEVPDGSVQNVDFESSITTVETSEIEDPVIVTSVVQQETTNYDTTESVELLEKYTPADVDVYASSIEQHVFTDMTTDSTINELTTAHSIDVTTSEASEYETTEGQHTGVSNAGIEVTTKGDVPDLTNTKSSIADEDSIRQTTIQIVTNVNNAIKSSPEDSVTRTTNLSFDDNITDRVTFSSNTGNEITTEASVNFSSSDDVIALRDVTTAFSEETEIGTFAEIDQTSESSYQEQGNTVAVITGNTNKDANDLTTGTVIVTKVTQSSTSNANIDITTITDTTSDSLATTDSSTSVNNEVDITESYSLADQTTLVPVTTNDQTTNIDLSLLDHTAVDVKDTSEQHITSDSLDTFATKESTTSVDYKVDLTENSSLADETTVVPISTNDQTTNIDLSLLVHTAVDVKDTSEQHITSDLFKTKESTTSVGIKVDATEGSSIADQTTVIPVTTSDQTTNIDLSTLDHTTDDVNDTSDQNIELQTTANAYTTEVDNIAKDNTLAVDFTEQDSSVFSIEQTTYSSSNPSTGLTNNGTGNNMQTLNEVVTGAPDETDGTTQSEELNTTPLPSTTHELLSTKIIVESTEEAEFSSTIVPVDADLVSDDTSKVYTDDVTTTAVNFGRAISVTTDLNDHTAEENSNSFPPTATNELGSSDVSVNGGFSITTDGGVDSLVDVSSKTEAYETSGVYDIENFTTDSLLELTTLSLNVNGGQTEADSLTDTQETNAFVNNGLGVTNGLTTENNVYTVSVTEDTTAIETASTEFPIETSSIDSGIIVDIETAPATEGEVTKTVTEEGFGLTSIDTDVSNAVDTTSEAMIKATEVPYTVTDDAATIENIDESEIFTTETKDAATTENIDKSDIFTTETVDTATTENIDVSEIFTTETDETATTENIEESEIFTTEIDETATTDNIDESEIFTTEADNEVEPIVTTTNVNIVENLTTASPGESIGKPKFYGHVFLIT